jgi:hypothetical protein
MVISLDMLQNKLLRLPETHTVSISVGSVLNVLWSTPLSPVAAANAAPH